MNHDPKHSVAASRRPSIRSSARLVVSSLVLASLAGCGGSQPPAANAPADESAAPPAAEAPPPAVETPSGEAAADGEAALGAKVYATRCALCHGATGNGDGPAARGLNPKPRAHTDKAYMSTLTDEQILAVIRNGKGTMPPWGKTLSEAELAAVARHVRKLGE